MMTQRGFSNERRVDAEAAYTERHSLTCGDNKNVSRCDDENGNQSANQLSLLPLLPLRFRDRKIFFLGGSLSEADAAHAAGDAADASAAAAAAAAARIFSAC